VGSERNPGPARRALAVHGVSPAPIRAAHPTRDTRGAPDADTRGAPDAE
jgi:hypothetical protein